MSKVRPFTRIADGNPARIPRSYDFYPGVSEVPLGDSETVWRDPEIMRGPYYAPQTDNWPNRIPSSMGGRSSDKQIFELLHKIKGFNKEQFDELRKKVKGPALKAAIANEYIRRLVKDNA